MKGTQDESLFTWENFDASIDVIKTEQMRDNWDGLAGKGFWCVVNNAANFGNLDGLNYSLPKDMYPGTPIWISIKAVLSTAGGDAYYLCTVEFNGCCREAHLSRYGTNPTARLSFSY